MDFRKNGTLTIRRKRNGRLESHPGVSEGVVEAILVVGYDEKGRAFRRDIVRVQASVEPTCLFFFHCN